MHTSRINRPDMPAQMFGRGHLRLDGGKWRRREMEELTEQEWADNITAISCHRNGPCACKLQLNVAPKQECLCTNLHTSNA